MLKCKYQNPFLDAGFIFQFSQTTHVWHVYYNYGTSSLTCCWYVWSNSTTGVDPYRSYKWKVFHWHNWSHWLNYQMMTLCVVQNDFNCIPPSFMYLSHIAHIQKCFVTFACRKPSVTCFMQRPYSCHWCHRLIFFCHVGESDAFAPALLMLWRKTFLFCPQYHFTM